MKWVLSNSVQIEQFAEGGQLPVRTDLTKNTYFDQEPRLVTLSTAMGLGRTPYSIHYNELFNDANGPWLTMLQSAIFDGNIDTAISTAQDSFTQILTQK